MRPADRAKLLRIPSDDELARRRKRRMRRKLRVWVLRHLSWVAYGVIAAGLALLVWFAWTGSMVTTTLPRMP